MAESFQPDFQAILTAGRELKRALMEIDPGERQTEFFGVVEPMRSLLTADSTWRKYGESDVPNPVIKQFKFDLPVISILQKLWVEIRDVVKLYWDTPRRDKVVRLVDELLKRKSGRPSLYSKEQVQFVKGLRNQNPPHTWGECRRRSREKCWYTGASQRAFETGIRNHPAFQE